MPRVTKKSEKASAPRAKRAKPANGTTSTPVGANEISRLAYEIYEARGRTAGSPLEDWLQAEQQLSNRAEV